MTLPAADEFAASGLVRLGLRAAPTHYQNETRNPA
jgi:hypothetical protein